MIQLSREKFERVVEQALEELPPEFSGKLKNLEIIVEDFPSGEVQENMKVNRRGLLGLYTGVPLNKRGDTYPPLFPDRIILYQKNLESFCRSHDELIDQIQRTVLHEIGHYFGIDDKRLRELGF